MKTRVDRRIIGSDRPHDGSQSAGLCGYNDCDESLAQTISLPKDARTISLSYYSAIITQETKHAFDFLNVELREPGGKTLQLIERQSDGDPAGVWRRSSFDLSSYAGRMIELVFRASCGKIRPTAFFVDDVSVTVK